MEPDNDRTQEQNQHDQTPLLSPTVAAKLPVIPDVRIDVEIGRGGMGAVYRGRQLYLDRVVAVKLLTLDPGQDGQDYLRRFQREAKLLAGLAHAHIVACYQAGISPDGQPFLVMECIDGPNLKQWIAEHGPLTQAQALSLTADLAAALEHAHGRGVIHRDVKPENVLLQRRADAAADEPFPYIPKLADLGLARPQRDLGDATLTRSGVIMGTPATMAPEQFDDPDGVDFRADIYGLGCVLFHALAGRPAFSGNSFAQLVATKVSGTLPVFSVPGLTPATAALLRDLLARHRDQRPRSYAEVISRCRAAITATPGRRAARTSFVLAGVLIAAAGVGWWLGQRAPVAASALPGVTPTVTTTTIAPTAPVVSAATPVKTAPTKSPLDQLHFAGPSMLLGTGFSTRLNGWTPVGNAVWVPAEESTTGIIGRRGVIGYPLTPPLRATAIVRLANREDARTDVVTFGTTLNDGTSMGVSVRNLGSSFLITVESGPQRGDMPNAALRSLTIDPAAELELIISADADTFSAAIGARTLAAVSLPVAPVGIFLAVDGPVPVEVVSVTAASVISTER